MKRLLACALIAIMVMMAFSACGTKKEAPSSDEINKNGEGTQSNTGGSSGNDSANSQNSSELLSLIDTSSEAALVNSASGLALKLNSDGQSYTVVGRGTHTAAALVIDDTYNGLPITRIGDYAFKGQTGITSITIGKNVTRICKGAFYGCSGVKNIESVTIPDTVTDIEYSVFSGTGFWNSDTWYSKFGQYALYIGNHLIYVSDRTTGAFTIKSGTKVVAGYAFSSLKVTSVTIPSSVTVLGDEVFSGCSQLSSVTIQGNLTHIGDRLLGRSLYYNTPSNWVDGVLYCGNYLIEAKDVSGLCTVKDNTKAIADWAFYGCQNLKGVVLPSSLISIGDHSFDGCRNLDNLTIPDSVIRIGESAFDTCTSLKTVRIPNNVTSISNYAFYNCENLQSISIPNSITSIGTFAFYGCSKLASINVPKNVSVIGESAFANCSNLKSISVDTSNTKYKSLGESLYTYDGKTLLQYAIGKPDAKFILPNGVTTIGPRAFYGSTILESVELASSVTSVDDTAFMGCTRLTSIKKAN